MSPENRSELNLYVIIAIRSLRNIDRGDQLYLTDGSEYKFPDVRFSSQSREIFLQLQKVYRRRFH